MPFDLSIANIDSTLGSTRLTRINPINTTAFINEIRERRHKFSRVVGTPISVQVEFSSRESRVDHVWITLRVSEFGHLKAAINTLSRLNRDAGFDGRVRVGVAHDTWETLPETGIFECDHLDYAEIENTRNIFYECRTKPEMEELLTRKAGSAIIIEVWGEIYAHNHVGVHQIHSRRASCAVGHDIVGRDGALKFYYEEENASEMLLFKFCGQA